VKPAAGVIARLKIRPTQIDEATFKAHRADQAERKRLTARGKFGDAVTDESIPKEQKAKNSPLPIATTAAIPTSSGPQETVTCRVSIKGIPRDRWSPATNPLFAISSRTDSKSSYVHQGHTERLVNNQDPSFRTTIFIKRPVGSGDLQIRGILYDAQTSDGMKDEERLGVINIASMNTLIGTNAGIHTLKLMSAENDIFPLDGAMITMTLITDARPATGAETRRRREAAKQASIEEQERKEKEAEELFMKSLESKRSSDEKERLNRLAVEQAQRDRTLIDEQKARDEKTAASSRKPTKTAAAATTGGNGEVAEEGFEEEPLDEEAAAAMAAEEAALDALLSAASTGGIAKATVAPAVVDEEVGYEDDFAADGDDVPKSARKPFIPPVPVVAPSIERVPSTGRRSARGNNTNSSSVPSSSRNHNVTSSSTTVSGNVAPVIPSVAMGAAAAIVASDPSSKSTGRRSNATSNTHTTHGGRTHRSQKSVDSLASGATTESLIPSPRRVAGNASPRAAVTTNGMHWSPRRGAGDNTTHTNNSGGNMSNAGDSTSVTVTVTPTTSAYVRDEEETALTKQLRALRQAAENVLAGTTNTNASPRFASSSAMTTTSAPSSSSEPSSPSHASAGATQTLSIPSPQPKAPSFIDPLAEAAARNEIRQRLAAEKKAKAEAAAKTKSDAEEAAIAARQARRAARGKPKTESKKKGPAPRSSSKPRASNGTAITTASPYSAAPQPVGSHHTSSESKSTSAANTSRKGEQGKPPKAPKPPKGEPSLPAALAAIAPPTQTNDTTAEEDAAALAAVDAALAAVNAMATTLVAEEHEKKERKAKAVQQAAEQRARRERDAERKQRAEQKRAEQRDKIRSLLADADAEQERAMNALKQSNRHAMATAYNLAAPTPKQSSTSSRTATRPSAATTPSSAAVAAIESTATLLPPSGSAAASRESSPKRSNDASLVVAVTTTGAVTVGSPIRAFPASPKAAIGRSHSPGGNEGLDSGGHVGGNNGPWREIARLTEQLRVANEKVDRLSSQLARLSSVSTDGTRSGGETAAEEILREELQRLQNELADERSKYTPPSISIFLLFIIFMLLSSIAIYMVMATSK
jgi:hypothetical protein